MANVRKPTTGPVLVVDDNEIKRYTTRRTLEKANIEIMEAATGEDALRLIRTASQRPRVVVLDIKLPDMDGYEVCRRIKNDPETASILVLHLSAHMTTSHDQAFGLDSGADAYLTVPVAPEVIIATVRSLLRLSDAEAEAHRAERHWRATFDAIGDAVCLLNTDGEVVRYNRAAADLFESMPDNVLGARLIEVLRQALGIDAAELLSLKASKALDVETETGRWFRITTDPIHTAEQPSGIVCVLSDVTARKLYEVRLAAAYEHEKNIAESFQHSLLTPQTGTFPHLVVEALYLPAWKESLVGGDFYDVFPLNEEEVALVIADASGKGLAAATRTAEVKYALRAFLWEGTAPDEAFNRLNRFVCRSQATASLSGFVTAILAVINTTTGDVAICSAGMDPPVLLRSAGEPLILSASGELPLGIDPTVRYSCDHWQMAPDDTLLMVTDGVVEARNGPNFFGYARMVAAATAALDAPSLRHMGETILDVAREFARGTFQDDVCLLLARWQNTDSGSAV